MGGGGLGSRWACAVKFNSTDFYMGMLPHHMSDPWPSPLPLPSNISNPVSGYVRLKVNMLVSSCEEMSDHFFTSYIAYWWDRCFDYL